jgi:hypothetical protein
VWQDLALASNLAKSPFCGLVAAVLSGWEVREQTIEIEKLKKENLKLTESVSPRYLEQQIFSNELKKFPNIKVLLVSVHDVETRETVGQLKTVFNMAGWKVTEHHILDVDSSMMIRKGITVERQVGAQRDGDTSSEAAKLLVAQLNNQKVQANTFPSIIDLEINTIRVVVGLKPTGYFLDKVQGNFKGNVTY